MIDYKMTKEALEKNFDKDIVYSLIDALLRDYVNTCIPGYEQLSEEEKLKLFRLKLAHKLSTMIRLSRKFDDEFQKQNIAKGSLNYMIRNDAETADRILHDAGQAIQTHIGFNEISEPNYFRAMPGESFLNAFGFLDFIDYDFHNKVDVEQIIKRTNFQDVKIKFIDDIELEFKPMSANSEPQNIQFTSGQIVECSASALLMEDFPFSDLIIITQNNERFHARTVPKDTFEIV